MRELLQTVLPAVLAALVAYQGGLTRTTRLRSMIRANVDLLGTLPADHPSRATLEAHIGELVDVLVRRQRRRFEPFTRAGVWFGVNLTAAVILLGGMGGLALEATGVWHVDPEPSPPREKWTFIGFYTAIGLCLAFFAFWAWRREHPTQPVVTLARESEPSWSSRRRSPFSPLWRCMDWGDPPHADGPVAPIRQTRRIGRFRSPPGGLHRFVCTLVAGK